MGAARLRRRAQRPGASAAGGAHLRGWRRRRHRRGVPDPEGAAGAAGRPAGPTPASPNLALLRFASVGLASDAASDDAAVGIVGAAGGPVLAADATGAVAAAAGGGILRLSATAERAAVARA